LYKRLASKGEKDRGKTPKGPETWKYTRIKFWEHRQERPGGNGGRLISGKQKKRSMGKVRESWVVL